jgi:anthranilate synthase component 2
MEDHGEEGYLNRLLVLDNYDSFTYNLVQMFMLYDLEIIVRRSDRISVEQVKGIDPCYILISPGPKDPSHTGISIPVIHAFKGDVPILGVCLGMQCVNEAFGGKTVRAYVPVHGKTSRIDHDGRFLFKDLPDHFNAARYHSLMSEPVGEGLCVTARSDDGVIMGLSHSELPIHGVQFHPESFMTEQGFGLVENFLRLGPLKAELDAGICG